MNLPRSQRSGSLRKLTQQQQKNSPMSPLSPRGSNTPLNRVVDEVLRHLMDIIQVLLSEENSNNYITFLNKVQEMCEQNQKKMMIRLEERLEQFTRQYDSSAKNKKDVLKEQPTTLRHQRKHITQSILSMNKSSSQEFSQQRSAELVRTATNLGGRGRVEEIAEEEGDKTMVNSIDLHSISARLSQVEHNQSRKMKDLGSTLEGRVDSVCKEVKRVEEEVIALRMKIKEELDCNLQALWNVITDIRATISANE